MTTWNRRAFTVIRSLVYAVAFAGTFVWIGAWARTFDAGLPALPAWLRPVGVALALAGALLVAVCVGTFATLGRGTPAPFDPPTAFVATGPYRYVRNPMYLGGVAAILGIGLALSSTAIVLFAAAFLLVIHAFVLLHEEPALQKRFGDSYRRYLASVHRWLVSKPRPKRPRGES